MNGLQGQPDAYLVGCIANGDAEAVRPLVDRYQRALAAVLHRALGGGSDFEDVAQETWIRVVRSARRYDPAFPFRGWLFAIAWNLVRDHWSRRRPDREDDLTAIPWEGASAEEEMMARDRARRVNRLIRSLPERLSETILLRYFEELSEKEVAARLGVPVGTVKSRTHDAISRLAKAWNEECA